jgi:hypothetical protein
LSKVPHHPDVRYKVAGYIAVEIRVWTMKDNDHLLCSCHELAKHHVRVFMPDMFWFESYRCDTCLKNWLGGRRFGIVKE